MLAPLIQNLSLPVLAPSITAQPQAAQVSAGATATFTVTAAGSAPLSYQWFKNGVAIVGATSSTYTTPPTTYPTDSGSQFYVLVSNSAGSIFSAVAVLLVLTTAVTTFIAPSTGTTANDIVTGALRRINSYMSGETIAAPDAEDVLETFNDLLESLSTDHATVFCSVENIFNFTSNQYQYTIGNYMGGSVAGSLTQGSNIVTNILPPSNMVVGGTLTDSYNALPPGTLIEIIGTNSLTLSAVPAFSVAVPSILSYTIPGDIPIARPLRITNGFTRLISGPGGIDFPFETTMDLSRYNNICLKGVPGPWPIAAFYNPSMPLGNIYFYPNPSMNAECHLWTDTILLHVSSLNQQLTLPQGYSRMLKWMLAREICTEYGFPLIPAIETLAQESLAMVKSLNQVPLPISCFDPALFRPRTDASWILTGGFSGSFGGH